MLDYASNVLLVRGSIYVAVCIVIRVRTMKLSGRVFNMQFRKVPALVRGFCVGRKLRAQLVLSSLSLSLFLFLSHSFIPSLFFSSFFRGAGERDNGRICAAS